MYLSRAGGEGVVARRAEAVLGGLDRVDGLPDGVRGDILDILLAGATPAEIAAEAELARIKTEGARDMFLDLIEARLWELEDRCSFTPDELDAIWIGLLPERAPPPLPTGRRVLTARMREALHKNLTAAEKRRDFSVSLVQWQWLVQHILPERYPEPPQPAQRTPYVNGSQGKLLVMVAVGEVPVEVGLLGGDGGTPLPLASG
jgi:hypothetical protein